MTPYQLRAKADEFGIAYPAAVRMRVNYLAQQVCQCCDWIAGDAEMPQVMYGEAIDEIITLKGSLIRQNTGQQVTDEMIEQARAVKITDILEFNRAGKCRCIASDHEDKNASAYYGHRTNKLVCPVCDKKWDSIAIQMHFTGNTFHQAVKQLTGRT